MHGQNLTERPTVLVEGLLELSLAREHRDPVVPLLNRLVGELREHPGSAEEEHVLDIVEPHRSLHSESLVSIRPSLTNRSR